ncbi:MAG: hypothetical protein EOP84_03910 [Verrucomicrobiaceae bacterium]|nr:MAG: hypothetical protein EOP84_03910 [Verrucomicrobiaceae bacterium]
MPLPHVSSEGGPIILADFHALRGWKGAFESSGHYQMACELLERSNPATMTFAGRESIVWDFGGPGTGDIILVSDSHISVVRIWPDSAWDERETEEAVISAATAQFGSEIVAHLTIDSGYLLALWAPEETTESSGPNGAEGVPTGLSIGDGGAYVRVPRGRYEITACEWQNGNFDVTKLDLRRVDNAA